MNAFEAYMFKINFHVGGREYTSGSIEIKLYAFEQTVVII